MDATSEEIDLSNVEVTPCFCSDHVQWCIHFYLHRIEILRVQASVAKLIKQNICSTAFLTWHVTMSKVLIVFSWQKVGLVTSNILKWTNTENGLRIYVLKRQKDFHSTFSVVYIYAYLYNIFAFLFVIQRFILPPIFSDFVVFWRFYIKCYYHLSQCYVYH